MEAKTPPKNLIKYYECNELNCDALINNYLWASHPASFNDPFDCPFDVWDISTFSEENLKIIIHPDFYNNLGHIFNNDPRDEFLRFIHLFIGIICLNEFVEDNEDLLWGYYTHQKGFAIEFDQQILSASICGSIEKIEYKDPKEFEIFSIPNNVESSNVLIPFFKNWIKQKKRIWSNETEWRYIFFDCNYNQCPEYGIKGTRKKKYETQAVKSIVLGFKFFESCFMQKCENGFIYKFKDIKDCSKVKILLFLFQRKKIPLFWIHMKGLTLERVPIKLIEINHNEIQIMYNF